MGKKFYILVSILSLFLVMAAAVMCVYGAGGLSDSTKMDACNVKDTLYDGNDGMLVEKTVECDVDEYDNDASVDNEVDFSESSICERESIITNVEDADINNETSDVSDGVEPDIPNDDSMFYYYISPDERDLIARLVMAEAGSVSYQCQMGIAQCILDSALYTGNSPTWVIYNYGYTSPASWATDSCYEAVDAVFERGEKITGYSIEFMRNNRGGWHETQHYIMTIDGVNFYARW